MAKIEGLIQRTPADGASISERTSVYLGYDAHHLHAVFVCSTESGAPRAHRVNRDRLPDDDDSVALHLDTFHDRRRLYGFQVNPAGVQVDGVYTEGQGWDLSFDTVWATETLIQPNRYVVVITIPFSSVRFSATPEQEWGFFVYRGIPRKSEEAFWPAYSQRFKGRLAYEADLQGLRDLDAGHAVQLIPYGTFRSERIASRDASGVSIADQLMESRGGVDAKMIVRGSVVFDVTANPDFSQVESDEPQTTVNKRFEVFFPEKRPFFIENASYFETPIPVLFTRRIRDPRLGARLSGKAGKWAIGTLVSDDIPEATAEAAAQNSGSRALDAVFRLSRDAGRDSQLGFIYTGRKEATIENHVGGFDARWRLNPHWTIVGQALASEDNASVTSSRTGTALRASVAGGDRRYAYELAFSDVSPDFHARMGFIPRADVRELTQVTTATFHPVTKRIVSWGPSVTLGRVWDHTDLALDSTAKVQTMFELPRATRLSVFHTMHDEVLRAQDSPLLISATQFDQRATGVSLG
jgi:hypothetical protein